MSTTGKIWINDGAQNRLIFPNELDTFLASGWMCGKKFNPRILKTHCKHGHEYTPENTYVSPSGRRTCDVCQVQNRHDWYKANPDAWREYRKNHPEKHQVTRMNAMWKARGIKLTVPEYVQMFEKQELVCALCGQPPIEPERLVPDHNHETGVIRGLIHRACNLLLGNAKDSPELLELAADYLKKSLNKIAAKAGE